jgi:hypothetical protein
MPKIIQTRWLTSAPVAQYVVDHFDEIVEFLSGSSSHPALVSLRELNIRDLSPVLAIFHDLIKRLEGNRTMFCDSLPAFSHALAAFRRIPQNIYTARAVYWLLDRFEHTANFQLLVATYLLTAGGHQHFRIFQNDQQYIDFLLSNAEVGLRTMATVFDVDYDAVLKVFHFYLCSMPIRRSRIADEWDHFPPFLAFGWCCKIF